MNCLNNCCWIFGGEKTVMGGVNPYVTKKKWRCK